MTKTQLSLCYIIVINLFHDFGEVGSAASLKFSDGFVERSGDSGFRENFLTHFWIDYTKQELLFLGALGGWEMSSQEVLED